MMDTAKLHAEINPKEDPEGSKHPLNRFLSKTYFMVNSPECPVVCWAPDGGRSFVILDVDEFSKNVLPLFFKHQKLSSFVRQLNFYGFRKMRTDQVATGSSGGGGKDDDSALSATSDVGGKDAKHLASSVSRGNLTTVRFYHEFFRADRPDLLHRIQRATKSAEPPKPSQIEYLKDQIEAMKGQMDTMVLDFDAKLLKLKTSMELNYERRISLVEASYKDLLSVIVKDRFHTGPSNISSSNHNNNSNNTSSSPLMTTAMLTGASLPSSVATNLLALRAAAGNQLALSQQRQQEHQQNLQQQHSFLSSLNVATAGGDMGLNSSHLPYEVFNNSLAGAASASAVSRFLSGPNGPTSAADMGLPGILGKYQQR